MYVAPESLQAVESVRYIVLLFATVSVVFWRVLIKIVVMVAAIAVLVLLASGAILILQSIRQLSG